MATISEALDIVGSHCYSPDGGLNSKAKYICIENNNDAFVTNVKCPLCCNRMCQIKNSITDCIELDARLWAALKLTYGPITVGEWIYRSKEVAEFVKEWVKKNNNNKRRS